MYLQQNPIDPSLPATLPDDQLTNWPSMLDSTLVNLFTPIDPPLLPLGMNLWTGLATIVVAWTGLRIAFAGAAFRPWDLVALVTGLMIPLWMLRFYATDIPGVGFSFPLLIPAGANQIAARFQGDMITEMNLAMHRVGQAFNQNFADAVTDQGVLVGFANFLTAGIEGFFTSIFGLVFTAILSLAFLGIFAITLAQVYWAKIAISILIFVGPAFIPWLVWKPMAFLFWGWFRAMLTYSFYSIIAAAMMRVWCALSLTLMESFVRDSLSFTDALDGGPSLHATAVIPLFVAAFLSATKIPELAGALGGANVSGGGMGALAATALTMGKGRVAKLAGGMK